MHFKYDQNLEMHNGIHAAIRGKLLEATFAPVWVEPLECSVMGGGFGEAGSTTAQTFALSGMGGGGGGSKRPRLLLRLGKQTLKLSQLLTGYCRLQDSVRAFTHLPVAGYMAKIKGGDPNYRDNVFHRDQPARQAIEAAWPAYHKLRRDLLRLDAEEFPPSGDNSLNDEEKTLAKKVESAKLAVHQLFSRQADYFPAVYVVNRLLGDKNKGASLTDPFQRLMMSGMMKATEMSWDPAQGKHRYFLEGDKFFKGDHVPDMELWKQEATFAASVVAAMRFAQNCEDVNWAGNLVVFNNTDNNRLPAEDLLAALMEASATLVREAARNPEDVAQMAVLLMPFLTLNLYIGENFSTPQRFIAGQNLLNLALITVNNIGQFFAISRIPQRPDLAHCLRDSEFTRNTLELFVLSRTHMANNRTAFGSWQTMVGSFLGGMFANSTFWKAHNESIATASRVPVIPVHDDRPRHSASSSRLSMMAVSEFMVAAGVVMGNVVGEDGIRSENCVANMATALFLVYLHLMMFMQNLCPDNMQATNHAGRQHVYGILRASNPPLEMMCRLAWDTVGGFAALNTEAEKQRHAVTQYRPREEPGLVHGGHGFMTRKLGKRLVHFFSSNFNGNVHTPSNLTRDEFILPEMHRVMCDKGLSRNRVYNIIFECIYSIDTVPVDAALTPGFGTNTRGAIPGAGEEGEELLTLGGEFATSDGNDRGDQSNNNKSDSTAHSTAAFPPIMLGSILLDRSEQVQQMQHQASGTAAAAAEGQEGLDAGAKSPPSPPSSEAADSASGAGAGTDSKTKKKAGSGGSGGSSGGLKRVQAKLL
jgi:hypothetical protein